MFRNNNRKQQKNVIWYYICLSDAYSVLYQTSMMERFAKIVNSYNPRTIFAKRSILDVWVGPEYASVFIVSFEHIHASFEWRLLVFLDSLVQWDFQKLKFWGKCFKWMELQYKVTNHCLMRKSSSFLRRHYSFKIAKSKRESLVKKIQSSYHRLFLVLNKITRTRLWKGISLLWNILYQGRRTNSNLMCCYL